MPRQPRFPSRRTLAPQASPPGLYASTCTPELGGEGLEAICRDRRMPSAGTVYGWPRRHPEFLARYRWAKSRVEDAMVGDACENLPWIGERKSWPMLRRTVRAAEKAARRLSLKRYAPAPAPAEQGRSG